MHRVFISYHHHNDQYYKDELVRWGERNNIFIDGSVDTGDIPDDWDAQKIREEIRDDYLADTTVTIVLVGKETMNRKHVDWEIYSSMHDGKVNKKSGIVVIMLPSVECCHYYTCAHDNEKTSIYPEQTKWTSINDRDEFTRRYPYMPERIIDNLLDIEAKISVVHWWDIYGYPDRLRLLIDNAYKDKDKCKYDMSRPMMMRNR